MSARPGDATACMARDTELSSSAGFASTDGREQRVTPLEVFFDLVFDAITQVTLLMSEDLTWHGVGRGLLVLGAFWWAWTGYAWLKNAREPEEESVRAGVFARWRPCSSSPSRCRKRSTHMQCRSGRLPEPAVLQLLLVAIAGKRDPGLLEAEVRQAWR